MSGTDSYTSLTDTAHGQKAQDAKVERPQADTHPYASKLSAGAGLEQSPSPIKAMESRSLPSSGAGSTHPYSRGQGKNQPQHHSPMDQSMHPVSASDLQPGREKGLSKTFSGQEQDPRALGKTTMTAASFIDVIIMRQISCDKGKRERSALNGDASSDGKTLVGAELQVCGLKTPHNYTLGTHIPKVLFP